MKCIITNYYFEIDRISNEKTMLSAKQKDDRPINIIWGENALIIPEKVESFINDFENIFTSSPYKIKMIEPELVRLECRINHLLFEYHYKDAFIKENEKMILFISYLEENREGCLLLNKDMFYENYKIKGRTL